MKKTLLFASALGLCMAANAQNDTLLFEDFNVDPTGTTIIVGAPSGNDPTWISLDEDGLNDANSGSREPHWYHSPDGAFVVPDTTGCYFSSSWLENFAPGNRNWLITPGIVIADANANLTWKAAPSQVPLYMDGYTVLVSTTDNLETSFTDTLWHAAQYLGGSGFDYSTYTFSDGYVHGLNTTTYEMDTNMVYLDTVNADSSRWSGRLSEFNASLAAYSGQTIYIAFLHNSDDDNILAIDDILVTGTNTVSVPELAELSFEAFPNPVVENLNIKYSLPVSSDVLIQVYDARGALVEVVKAATHIKGDYTTPFDMSHLAAGTYTIKLQTQNGEAVTTVVKQ